MSVQQLGILNSQQAEIALFGTKNALDTKALYDSEVGKKTFALLLEAARREIWLNQETARLIRAYLAEEMSPDELEEITSNKNLLQNATSSKKNDYSHEKQLEAFNQMKEALDKWSASAAKLLNKKTDEQLTDVETRLVEPLVVSNVSSEEKIRAALTDENSALDPELSTALLNSVMGSSTETAPLSLKLKPTPKSRTFIDELLKILEEKDAANEAYLKKEHAAARELYHEAIQERQKCLITGWEGSQQLAALIEMQPMLSQIQPKAYEACVEMTASNLMQLRLRADFYGRIAQQANARGVAIERQLAVHATNKTQNAIYRELVTNLFAANDISNGFSPAAGMFGKTGGFLSKAAPPVDETPLRTAHHARMMNPLRTDNSRH